MISSNQIAIKTPLKTLNLVSYDFQLNKYAYYAWLRENAPVYKGKMAILPVFFVSRYEDCVSVLKDPRFVRNRSTATGGGRFPIPLPRALNVMLHSMINEDEPEHRRLRTLVHKAFTPATLAHLEARIEALTHELLDSIEKERSVDLMQRYALPIPVTVISEMVGVSTTELPQFTGFMNALSQGFSGWKLARTIFWELPSGVKYVQGLIERKRQNPQADILSGLIKAEENGDRLSEDELIAMVFLLILAGYETTVHLIINAVQALLTHPDQLERLRAHPELMESAVEEVNRFNGPIHSTKPMYATEDVTLHGVTIAKGKALMPLLGAANHDATVFANPELLDIARTPNRHLGFGQGIHYCLGAPLARIETRIALRTLLERSPNLKLAVAPEELKLQPIPSWHRYQSLPVVLG